jgi:hypothetical protein
LDGDGGGGGGEYIRFICLKELFIFSTSIHMSPIAACLDYHFVT